MSDRFRDAGGRLLDKAASAWRRVAGAAQRLKYRSFVDQNRDYAASVLLAGSGRGGTTWVAEVLNFDNAYRMMFEPFNNLRVRECREFSTAQYLRPHDDDPRFLQPAQHIFSGQIRNKWVDAYNRNRKVGRRLIKDIRVNLLLGWIRAHFPQTPIILLLRHPCAVAYSRCKLGWDSNLESAFLWQEPLVEDFLRPFLPLLGAASSEFERHILWWCIETYVPLMQLGLGDIFVTTYEDCVTSPATEFKRIFDFLEKPFTEQALGQVKKPSTQTRWNWRSRNASAIISGQGIVDSWQTMVDPQEARKALVLLQRFGLDAIYDLNALPKENYAGRFARDHGLSRYPTF